MPICALCEREVTTGSRHHLVPKAEGGREVAILCRTCHKTLHAFFENRTLARELHTIEALHQQPNVQRYLEWIRKQPDRAIRVRTSRSRR